uniref:Uncharacterized protein n=1 Tax=Drosophila melanogaster TaxID=7227 RepID=A0ACD4DAV6_DROME|nr:uncharacterized protein Dmel_CG46511 [Drosophila melanogaster]UYK33069.1 uncharacterized protein Dmel_CG46511 [Drosophila melanogaster]
MKEIKRKSKPKRKPTRMEVEEIETSDKPQPEDGESANGEANPSDEGDEMELASFQAACSSSDPAKKIKKGIIYISNIPKHMTLTRLREILGEYGGIGRAFLRSQSSKHHNILFAEGWVEFKSKHVAKQLVLLLNNKQISTRNNSPFYYSLWSMEYLPRFKWARLAELMNFVQVTNSQNHLEFLKKKAKEAKEVKKAMKVLADRLLELALDSNI